MSDHLNALKMLGLVTIDFDEGRRWIGIKRPGLDTLPEKVAHKFVPWVDFEQGLIPELNISEQFVLSYLANEACIFARSEMGLSLPLSNVINTGRSLIQNQVLSRDSFNRALNSLQEKGCITMVKGKNNPYLILNFDGRYQALLRVDPSHNANFITNQWAMRRIADRVDNPATRCERAIMAKLVTRDQKDLVDVLFNLPERNGTIYVFNSGYLDTDGSYHIGLEDLPYFENSLAQNDVPRNNEAVPPSSELGQLSPLPESVHYTDVSRAQFYALDSVDQWTLTLEEALDDPALVQGCKKVYSENSNFFTPDAKKAILLDGLKSYDYCQSDAQSEEPTAETDTTDAKKVQAPEEPTAETDTTDAKRVQAPSQKGCTPPQKRRTLKNVNNNVFSTQKRRTSDPHSEHTSKQQAPATQPSTSKHPRSSANTPLHAAATSLRAQLVLDGWDPDFVAACEAGANPWDPVYETYSPWDASPESELDPDSPEAEAADLIADGWDPDFVATLTADKSQPDTPNGLTPEAAELIADGWDPAFVATSLAADESSEANDDADLPSPESVAAPEMASGEKITSPRQPEGATAHKVRAPACAIFDAFDSDPASDEAEAGLEPQHGAKDFSPAGPSKPEESRTSRVRAPAWAIFDAFGGDTASAEAEAGLEPQQNPEAEAATEVAELIADGWDPDFLAASLAAGELDEANDDADLPSPESVAAPEMASGEKITSPSKRSGLVDRWLAAQGAALMNFDAFGSGTASAEAEAGLESQHGAKDFSPAGPSKPEESRTSRVRAPAWAVFDPLDEQPKHSTPSTEAKTAPKKSKPQRRRSTGAKAVGTKPKRTTP